ncbi:MAG: hypothetical protein PHP99_11880 [Paludibacter sp.]|nr:hypothetical protein [Paludibacter sp.]
MKKFTLIISMIITCNIAFGQIVLSNGEDTGLDWWQAGSTKVEYVDYHPKEGNPSAKCMTIWISPDSEAWSGGGLSGLNIDVSAYNKISVLVYKNVAGDVQLEIQSDGEQNKDWLKVWYSEDNLGKWQKLTFKIPENRTAIINNILVAPHAHDAGQPVVFTTHRVYWDELIALPKE